MKLIDLLLEAIPREWYHGTSVDFKSFDYQYAFVRDRSNAQYGPGFYLTTNKSVALGYANGGFVKTVTLGRVGGFKKPSKRASYEMVKWLVDNMPDADSVLEDWAEEPWAAKQALMRGMTMELGLLDMIQNVWYNCYRGSEATFLKFLVERFGIDGIVVDEPGFSPPSSILVGYNVDLLKITKTETADEVRAQLLAAE